MHCKQQSCEPAEVFCTPDTVVECSHAAARRLLLFIHAAGPTSAMYEENKLFAKIASQRN
jgi:hypothetical protein